MQFSQPGALRRIPPILLSPLQYAPLAVLKPVLDMGLRAFFRDSIDQQELDILDGRRVCLEIKDAGLKLVLGVEHGHPFICDQPPEVDLTISGNLEEFVLLAANREDPDTQFFQRRLAIEGDTELALEVKNLIYSLDPDRFPPAFTRMLGHLGQLIERTRDMGL